MRATAWSIAKGCGNPLAPATDDTIRRLKQLIGQASFSNTPASK